MVRGSGSRTHGQRSQFSGLHAGSLDLNDARVVLEHHLLSGLGFGFSGFGFQVQDLKFGVGVQGLGFGI